jgi:SAM-dependent methyltransferase
MSVEEARHDPEQAASAASDEAVWMEVECGPYEADLPLWRELVGACARGGACELLDVGCGTGRVSLALAGPACRVTAIDSDSALVSAVRARAAAQAAPVEAIHADARSFALERRFDLALAPMQVVQLLLDERDRAAMLARVASHLRPGGLIAVALLDVDEEWESRPGDGPVPDMMERDGWVYASHPVAVRHTPGRVLELDRVRRMVSPRGELSESFHRAELAILTPAQVEREAVRAAPLTVEPRRSVPATEVHVGSAVVVLRRDG